MSKLHVGILVFIFSSVVNADIIEVVLSQKTKFKQGDVIKLKGSPFSVKISHDPGTECAVPGKNCGAGYIPPHPTFIKECGTNRPCPYNIMMENTDGTSGTLSIEDEASCLKQNVSSCMSIFSQEITSDLDCSKLKTLVGRYYCLDKFPDSKREENKTLCDQLPDSIYALQWNCYYEYAIRYRDPGYCDKYAAKDISGKDRCWLKMAELMKDSSFCKKISDSKEHNYKEQCSQLH